MTKRFISLYSPGSTLTKNVCKLITATLKSSGPSAASGEEVRGQAVEA